MSSEASSESLTPGPQTPGGSAADPEAPADPAPRRKPLKVKAWHVLFLIVVVACTFALAWWQWTRFRSGSGTFQNLGYALQWPFFGAFFVYAYRKFMEYENEKILDDDFVAGPATGAIGATKEGEVATEISADFLPSRPQLTVEEFNALNQQRRHRGET